LLLAELPDSARLRLAPSSKAARRSPSTPCGATDGPTSSRPFRRSLRERCDLLRSDCDLASFP